MLAPTSHEVSAGRNAVMSWLRALALLLFMAGCAYDEGDDRLPGRSEASAPAWVTAPLPPDERAALEMPPETPHDRALSDDVAERVLADDTLAMPARDVEILARGAVVTLRGRVRSEAVRQAVERHARAVPGVMTVRNELTVTF
jgi:hypothetical protein